MFCKSGHVLVKTECPKGRAASLYYSIFGVYKKLADVENNGKPVWKHFHENINVYLFNSNLGFWKIGLEYTQTFSLIENRLIGKELIPQKKWRYWNNTRFI